MKNWPKAEVAIGPARYRVLMHRRGLKPANIQFDRDDGKFDIGFLCIGAG
jgi:hypothetical protein